MHIGFWRLRSAGKRQIKIKVLEVEQLNARGETSVVPGRNISLSEKRALSPQSDALSARERERTDFLSKPGRSNDFALSAPRKNPRHDLLEGIKRQGDFQVPAGQLLQSLARVPVPLPAWWFGRR